MLNIVITGCFNESAIDGYGRHAVRSMIQRAGHKVQSDINTRTDYLCIGTANVPGRGAGPSKLAKAKDLGVQTVTLEELRSVLDAA